MPNLNVKKVFSLFNPLNWGRKEKKQPYSAVTDTSLPSGNENQKPELNVNQPGFNKTSSNVLNESNQKKNDSTHLNEFDQKDTNSNDQKNTDSINVDTSDQTDIDRLVVETVSADSNSTEEKPSFVNELSNAIDTVSEHCSSMTNMASSDENCPDLTENNDEHYYGLEIIFVGGTIILVIATITYIQKKNKNND